MNILKLITKSIWHFRKQHLAVLAGTVLSTAVLTGALIIGDSVKYSLRQMVDLRLGKAKYAVITGNRFVRSELANEISKGLNINSSPLLSVQGVSINPNNNKRINRSSIYGIDSTFWQFSDFEGYKLANEDALISENTAYKLNLQVGDEFLLKIENAEVIPLNAPFASQENPSVSMRVKVKGILNEHQLGRFSIKSDQKAPENIFVSRKVLEKKLELDGLSNLIIFSKLEGDITDIEALNNKLKKLWQIEDASLKIKQLDEKGTYELVSSRIFIENQVGQAIEDLKYRNEPVLTYLVNSIELKNKLTPYSFVTAASQPLISESLNANEIVINSWLADDLNAKVGDTLNLAYYIIGPLRKLEEKSSTFIIKEIIPIENNESLKSLMPAFPGLSDAGHCRDWETGVPINLDKIRDKDEEYWNVYKGTPKAFISIEAGQKLWESQFGKLSAIRFNSSQVAPSQLKKDLIAKLNPEDFNISVQDVYDQGVEATVNAVDFGELFLSLSFFVIVGGVLLTLLLHALNTESRSAETGLLAGIGFTQKTILKIKIGESLIIVVLGGIIGAVAGILYNQVIMAGLNSVWYDVVRTNMINVFIKPATLFIGAISGIIISLISIYIVSKRKLKSPVALLIKKGISSDIKPKSKQLLNKIIYLTSFVLVIFILIYSFGTSVEKNSSLFLTAGGLFLVACTALISSWFGRQKKQGNTLNINTLSIKNAGKNKSRSITTIVLLALGVFVILITGANRQTFYGTNKENSSGTGGYLFWAENSLPIIDNLNTEQGREKLGIEEVDLPKNTSFMQFHSIDGNDASCLNLNQVQKPRILGVDAAVFHQRGSFSFAELLNGIDADSAWLSLNKKMGDNIIPGVADQTVLVWGLKKAVGDTLFYKNEKGEEIKVLIIGGLNNSIFQGNLLIADEFLTQNFPSASGSKTMLIDTPPEKAKNIENYLTTYLADYGLELEKTDKRLAEFNSVTNTYLTVFMALGGLGVLIGTIGLGVVLLRNILERKPELALMMAIGFTKRQLFDLVLKENLFLLFAGIVIGILAAIIGILPSILSPAFEIPGTFVFLIVVIVIISGIVWIYFPTRFALKSVPVKALRRE